MYRKCVKPVLDRLLALICIFVFLPISILIVIAIKIDSTGPVLFVQERLGKNGKIFRILKFRTMVDHAADYSLRRKIYESDRRITKVGRVLRKTSLDEIPQFINILLGQMSFIGPRPLLQGIPYDYKDYPPVVATRFLVLPGLFCTVDTVYRAEASFEVQFEMDAQYVNSICFLGDLEILFKTFLVVITQKGIYTKADNSVAAIGGKDSKR